MWQHMGKNNNNKKTVYLCINDNILHKLNLKKKPLDIWGETKKNRKVSKKKFS